MGPDNRDRQPMTTPNKFQIALHYDITQYLAEKGVAFQNGQIERNTEIVLTIHIDGTDMYIFTDGAEFTAHAGRTSFEKPAFRNNAELAAAVMEFVRTLN